METKVSPLILLRRINALPWLRGEVRHDRRGGSAVGIAIMIALPPGQTLCTALNYAENREHAFQEE